MNKIFNRETIVYVIFGVLTTLVNWIIYMVFLNLFHMNINISNIFAWIGAVLFAYITNKTFVFQSHCWRLKYIIKECMMFFSSRMLSGVIEIGGFAMLISLGFRSKAFGIEGFFAKVAISIIVIIVNYIFSKMFVFKGDGENNDTEN